MKKIILSVIVACFSSSAFAQISCIKLYETSVALRDGYIKGKQIIKDTCESTVILNGQIDSYVVNIGDTIKQAYFIFLKTYSEAEAINKYEELRKLLKTCKMADSGELSSERAYSILISRGLYITAYYFRIKNNSNEYTVLIRFTHNL